MHFSSNPNSSLRQLALAGPGGTLPLSRAMVEGLATFFVGLLDVVEPDADIELNGDEEDASGDERDGAWIEWTTMRGSQKRGANIASDHEDIEDDDADTSVEDGPKGFDPETDFGSEELGELDDGECGVLAHYGIDQSKGPANEWGGAR